MVDFKKTPTGPLLTHSSLVSLEQTLSRREDRGTRYRQWSERGVVVGFDSKTKSYDVIVSSGKSPGSGNRKRLNSTIRKVKALIPPETQRFAPGDSILLGYVGQGETAEAREHPVILGQGDNIVQKPPLVSVGGNLVAGATPGTPAGTLDGELPITFAFAGVNDRGEALFDFFDGFDRGLEVTYPLNAVKGFDPDFPEEKQWIEQENAADVFKITRSGFTIAFEHRMLGTASLGDDEKKAGILTVGGIIWSSDHELVLNCTPTCPSTSIGEGDPKVLVGWGVRFSGTVNSFSGYVLGALGGYPSIGTGGLFRLQGVDLTANLLGQNITLLAEPAFQSFTIQAVGTQIIIGQLVGPSLKIADNNILGAGLGPGFVCAADFAETGSTKGGLVAASSVEISNPPFIILE